MCVPCVYTCKPPRYGHLQTTCLCTYVRTYVQVLSSTYVGLFQGSGNENYPYRCGCATHMGTGIAWWCQPFRSNQKVEQRAYSL